MRNTIRKPVQNYQAAKTRDQTGNAKATQKTMSLLPEKKHPKPQSQNQTTKQNP